LLPKSGWRFPPKWAIVAAEPARTGAWEMSVFHGLSAGKTGQPPSVVPGPADGRTRTARAVATSGVTAPGVTVAATP
jgi:hypothetical protein